MAGVQWSEPTRVVDAVGNAVTVIAVQTERRDVAPAYVSVRGSGAYDRAGLQELIVTLTSALARLQEAEGAEP